MVAFAVNHPVTIGMMVLGVLLLGKISYDRLSVDLLPDLNNPRLFIEIKAGERPPEEIEKQFVRNIESMAIRQNDVTEVSSVIRAGSARITVEYTWKKDMDEAFIDLQKAMNPFTQEPDLEELKITQHDPNLAPVLLIGMSHRTLTDMSELRKIAVNYIRNELIRLEGVAEVSLSGEEVSVLTIEADPRRLDAHQLKVEDIAQRIEANNRSLSGGRVSEMGLQYLVKSPSLFAAEVDFENLIVATAADADNAPLLLKEVATVRFENQRPENIVRINGQRCLGLSVYKEMRFNTVRVTEEVSKRLRTIEQALPGYRFQVISNQGAFIRQAIDEVKGSALAGIALAVVVLFIFLRRLGATLIVSLAIPISIVTTFNLMFFQGLTLNIMTLGGLALGAGMLVDNAIVVIESIFRNHEAASPPGRASFLTRVNGKIQQGGEALKEAIITGTSEVAGAVTASTLTTIVVFLPIVYLHGASGALFKDQAWTVAFSLLSSLFVALWVIPMLYYRIFGGRRRQEEAARPQPVRITGYARLLRRLIAHSLPVAGGAALCVAGTVLLLPLVGTEFMPRTEGKAFTISVKLPEGATLERTDAAVGQLEELLHTLAGDSASIIYTHAGAGSGSENAVFEGDNTAMMKVILSPACALAPEMLIARFIETAETPGSLELNVRQEENSLQSFLGGESAPIAVEVKGEDLDEIAALTEEVKARLMAVNGLYNIRSSVEDGAPEVSISIDRTLAGMNNLSIATITQQLQQQLGGREAGQMEYRGEMRRIRIQTPGISLGRLGEVVIHSGEQSWRLNEIATLEHTEAPQEIFRRNQSRIGKVMADMEAGHSLDKLAGEVRSAVSGIETPANYSILVAGEEAKRQESVNSLLFALALSVVLVYMTLASQFESLLHPFTILLTIPLATTGAVWLFFLTGTTVNIMGIIGIVMLAGIAVNNAIILVDRINQLAKAGLELTEAIVQAGQQRIRPIIMTSLTTILALLPLALRIGEGSSLRSPMAIAVVGGLITSTLMSLIVIPCVYYLLERLKRRWINRQPL
jgi:HAE1 family hydrophobic/amphiphilic exporter-1